MNAPVTVVGEALIDIVVPCSGEPVEHVGGSPANVAVGLARLGHPTRLATHIGTDLRGERILRLLRSEDVELIDGSTTAARTPTAIARLDAHGIATYDFDLDWQLDAAAVCARLAGHLHTGSIAATLLPGAHAVARVVEATRAKATVSYDPNVRPSLMGTPEQARPVIERLVALADVVKASEEDVEWLYPGCPVADVLSGWAGLGPSLCVLTRGGDEAIALVRGELRSCPTLPSAVADTVGAGDSFMAGLVSGLLDAGLLGDASARDRLRAAAWAELAPSLSRALACAAITVSRPGADPPRREELAS